MRGCSAAVGCSPTDFPLLAHLSSLLAVSGTVTLELAAADVPSVVIYRSNLFTQFLAKVIAISIGSHQVDKIFSQRLAAVEFISLPNLLLGLNYENILCCRINRDGQVKDCFQSCCLGHAIKTVWMF